MTKTTERTALAVALFLSLTSIGGAADKPSPDKVPTKRAPDVVRTPDVAPEEAPPSARLITYGDQDVVTVKTKVRYTTLIVLPKTELILDITCGDKDYWVVNGNQNFAYVKPAKPGARTNLNLVTTSGNIYSFMLAEVSEEPKAQPDLKLFVELKEESMRSAAHGTPRFVSAQEIETCKAQAEKAQEEARQAKEQEQTAIRQGISRFISNVRFPYRFEAGKKPFFVRAMYHDDRFTYIQARPEETPTLYEIKDGQPNLVNFQYRDGAYVVEKILDKGYLAIGKQKLSFAREE
jgi:type IV secretory pathway VirB9-like protein